MPVITTNLVQWGSYLFAQADEYHVIVFELVDLGQVG
jgi:hypothetical protein